MRSADATSLEAVDPGWGGKAARPLLERPATAGMVARGEEGTIMGFIVGQVSGGETEIIQITVAEPARRRGIGSALLKAFLSDHAGKTCFLEVREDNAAAIAFYQRWGFAPAGIRKDYYRGPDGRVDAVRMRLDTSGAPD